MLTLDSGLRIPASVLSTTVGPDAVLLNAESNKYFTLDEVGARLWSLIAEGRSFRESYAALLAEYEVEPELLEHDLLQLVHRLLENKLLEIESGS